MPETSTVQVALARLAALVIAPTLLACAPIDSQSTVTLRPQTDAPTLQLGHEQLLVRDFQADYVQLGGRLLLELRELPRCVQPRHRPVTRIETIDRSARGFVIWDFVLGTFTGGFAALAFAKPQLFATRLVDPQGRIVHDYTSAWVTGGVFAGISAILLTAGVVNAVRVTDSTHYADAYQVELGPAHDCPGGPTPAADRRLRLLLGSERLLVEAHSDGEGRARFELPPSTGDAPDQPLTPAVIEIGSRLDDEGWEPQVLVLQLRVPWTEMIDAHTGRADSREAPEGVGALLDLGPSTIDGAVEGPKRAPVRAEPPADATDDDEPTEPTEPTAPKPLDLGPRSEAQP